MDHGVERGRESAKPCNTPAKGSLTEGGFIKAIFKGTQVGRGVSEGVLNE